MSNPQEFSEKGNENQSSNDNTNCVSTGPEMTAHYQSVIN